MRDDTISEQYHDELMKWSEKDGTNHRLSTLLRNTSLRMRLLEMALDRQCENMSFVLNRVSLPDQWEKKFADEYVKDWQLVGVTAGEKQPWLTQSNCAQSKRLIVPANHFTGRF